MRALLLLQSGAILDHSGPFQTMTHTLHSCAIHVWFGVVWSVPIRFEWTESRWTTAKVCMYHLKKRWATRSHGTSVPCNTVQVNALQLRPVFGVSLTFITASDCNCSRFWTRFWCELASEWIGWNCIAPRSHGNRTGTQRIPVPFVAWTGPFCRKASMQWFQHWFVYCKLLGKRTHEIQVWNIPK